MSKQNNAYLSSMITIGGLFFIFGFITWLNGILIPFLQTACQLTDFQAYLVTSAFFFAYFLMAIPSSFILEKIGTKNGMVFGLLIMAIGCLAFIPAAQSRSYEMFLGGLFILATGLTLLQTAANPYVSVIGAPESAATRISIMGICNKFAGIIGNLLIGGILLKGVDAINDEIKDVHTDENTKINLLNSLVQRVIMPYSIFAVILVLIAVVIYFSSLKDINEQTSADASGETEITKGKTSIFQFSHVMLGGLAIFAYVAVEVMAGDLIGTYGKNLGFSTEDSKYFTSFGLIGLLLGYVTSIFLIPKFVKQEVWLIVSAILGIILSIVATFASPNIAVFSLASLGFANAVMWPAIFPLGIKNIGRFTNIGSAILIMGIIGGAIVPPLYAKLYASNFLGLDFRTAFLLLMTLCYIYIIWFGKIGHKTGELTTERIKEN
jgi:MFS transporter, FHS family, L-fucose permease